MISPFCFGKEIKMIMIEFIEHMREMLQSEDKTPVLDWVEFAENMSDNSETDLDNLLDLENLLDDIYSSLCYVKNNFSSEVFQKSLNMILLSNEIIYGAILFNNGYDYDEIRQLANEGVLGNGYIPSDNEETGTLALIQINESEDCFEVHNEPPSMVTKIIRSIARVSENGEEMCEMLKDRNVTDGRMYMISNQALIDSFNNAFNTTSAVGRMFTCSLEKGIIDENVCPVLKAQEEEQFSEYDNADDENLEIQM